MGNKILMAVRHNNLDEVEKLNFKEIEHAYVHRSDSLPKLFDGNGPWMTSKDRFFHSHHPDVLMSQYYHYSGSPLLYVDDLKLVEAYSLGHSYYDGTAEKDVNDLNFNNYVTGLKRHLRSKKISVLDRQGKITRPIRAGHKVSLFEIWTDCVDRVENNEYAMTDIVHYCRTGEINPRTFGSISMGIGIIGTIDSNKAALVRMKGAQASVYLFDRFDMVEEENDLAEIIKSCADDETFKAIDISDLALTREIAAAHGYLVQPMTVKKHA
jgi:hypothetical protein